MADGIFNKLTMIEKIVTIAGAIAVVVQTAFTIYTSMRTSEIENRVRTLQGDIADRAEHRQFDNNNAQISKEVLGEIKAAQQGGDDLSKMVDQLMVSSAYVEVIPSEQVRKEFRNAVQRLIDGIQVRIQAKKAETSEPLAPEIRQQQALLDDLTFSIQSQQAIDDRAIRIRQQNAVEGTRDKAPKKVDWSNYDFDIFWCDGTSKARQSKALADKIAALKLNDPDAKGDWRVRPLPLLTNQRPDYGVKGFEIRISSEDERHYATSLSSEADKLLHNLSYNERFNIRNSSTKTPWYLSAFICPI